MRIGAPPGKDLIRNVTGVDDARRSGGLPRTTRSSSVAGSLDPTGPGHLRPADSCAACCVQSHGSGSSTRSSFGAAWFAWKNVKAGRGDRRGAMRLAAIVVVLCTARWIFGAHHVFSDLEFYFRQRSREHDLVRSVSLASLSRRRALCASQLAAHADFLDSLARRRLPRPSGRPRPAHRRDGFRRARPPPWARRPHGLGGSCAASPEPHPPEYVSSPSREFAYFLVIPVERLVWTLGLIFFLVLARRLVRSEVVAAIMVTLLFSAPFLGQELPIVLVNVLATGFSSSWRSVLACWPR